MKSILKGIGIDYYFYFKIWGINSNTYTKPNKYNFKNKEIDSENVTPEI